MTRKAWFALALAMAATAALSAQRADDKVSLNQRIDAKRGSLRDGRQGNLGVRGSRLPGSEEQRAPAAGVEGRRLPGPRGRRRHPDRIRRQLRIGQAGHRRSSANSTRCRACRRKRRRRQHHAIEEGGAGHGCGHNLLGTGALAAAVAVKEWLARGHAGTLRYYGTPAEEGGCGKVYMVRAGLFNDVDVAVSWHPGDRNEASPTVSTANITGKFRFHGVAAHAAAAPDRGRSALDAVEAMDYMVNMMREHVPQETRIHYIITRGGAAPNIVPDFAEAYYYARHPNMKILDGIWERIVDAANGAAIGTGTKMELEITGAVYNVLPNEYLSGVMNANLEKVGGFTYTPEEIRVRGGDPKDADRSARRAARIAGAVRPMRGGAVMSASTDLRRRQLERSDGVDDRGDIRAWRSCAQLAGDCVRRRDDRREGDDRRSEDQWR